MSSVASRKASCFCDMFLLDYHRASRTFSLEKKKLRQKEIWRNSARLPAQAGKCRSKHDLQLIHFKFSSDNVGCDYGYYSC